MTALEHLSASNTISPSSTMANKADIKSIHPNDPPIPISPQPTAAPPTSPRTNPSCSALSARGRSGTLLPPVFVHPQPAPCHPSLPPHPPLRWRLSAWSQFLTATSSSRNIFSYAPKLLVVSRNIHKRTFFAHTILLQPPRSDYGGDVSILAAYFHISYTSNTMCMTCS